MCCDAACARYAPVCMCCDSTCACFAPACMCRGATCTCSAPACMCCDAADACTGPVCMCCNAACTCCAPAYICRDAVCEDSASIALTRKQRTCPDRAGDRARRRRPEGRGQTASLVEMSTESAAAAGCWRRVVASLSSTAAAAAVAKSDSARRKSGPTVGLPATAARDSVRHLRPACKWLAPSDGSLPTEIHVEKNSSESTKSSSIFNSQTDSPPSTHHSSTH